MAVENRYTNSNYVGADATVQTLPPGTLLPSCEDKGEKVIAMVATFETLAAWDDGSVLRVFRGLPSSLKPRRITIMCDALAGMTDNDLGFYPTDGGLIASAADGDKDVLMDGQTFASASRVLDGMSNVAIEDVGRKSIADLLGHSVEAGTDKGFYDMAITSNTIGNATATVCVHAEFFVQ